MKFAGVFDSVGMGPWVVDARVANASQAVARTIELFNQREQVRGPLAEKSADARTRLRTIFQELTGGGMTSSVSRPPGAGRQGNGGPARRPAGFNA